MIILTIAQKMTAADQEKEFAKVMLSNKKRRLYEKMQYGIKQKSDAVQTLERKRELQEQKKAAEKAAAAEAAAKPAAKPAAKAAAPVKSAPQTEKAAGNKRKAPEPAPAAKSKAAPTKRK
jgi:hypothetical protein